MTPDQATLFDPAPAGALRHEDPVTSLAAARKQRGGTEAAIRDEFARYDLGNLTDDELCDRLNGYHPPTVKSARSRLSKAGWLEDAGVRRDSGTGTPMICWRRAR